MKAPEGKKFYGSITVSERGQIVIPIDARKDFKIKTGDRLLVFGDMERGIGLATFDLLVKTMEGTMDLMHEIGSTMQSDEKKKPETDDKPKHLKS